MKTLILRGSYLFIIVLFASCDPLCSGDKAKEDDLIKIKNIDTKYEAYDIGIDKCFPLGYFNVTVQNENKLDTLLLDKIFYEVLDSNISPKEMQVLNEEGKLLYIQNNYYNPNTKENKSIRLKPEDL